MGRILAVLSAGVLLSAHVAYAQPAATFETWNVADTWAVRVADWRFLGSLSLSLTIGIGLLGVVVAFLQALKKRSWKMPTAILSSVITALTVVNTQMFDVGHRSYRSAVAAAEPKVDDIRMWVRPYPTDDERREAIAIVRRLLAELNAIRERLNSGPPASSGGSEREETSWLPRLLPELLAQSAAKLPAWTRGREPEGDRIYFVGVGIDSSISVARRVAQDNAFTAVRDDLVGRLPGGQGFDAEALGDYLAEAAVIADTYFERDAKTGQYRYYSLVALSKSGIETDSRLFGFREKVRVPATAVRAAQNVRASSVDYQIKRQEVYSQLSRTAQAQVAPDVYRSYETARAMRLRGDPRGALPALEEVVKRSPEFFMAWYNLALARSASGDRVKAEEAYRQAVALEPSQPVREASVYNSYGHFLLESGRKEESRRMFEKALAIDPKHPMAQRSLALAKAR